MGNFFDLEESGRDESDGSIGQGLIKANTSRKHKDVDPSALKEVGGRTGFNRTTGEVDDIAPTAPRRGRPPRHEEMTYWRIYIKPTLRNKLSELRDTRGVRMNDLIEEMYEEFIS